MLTEQEKEAAYRGGLLEIDSRGRLNVRRSHMTKEEKRRKESANEEAKIVSHAFAILQADGCKYPRLFIRGGDEPDRLYAVSKRPMIKDRRY